MTRHPTEKSGNPTVLVVDDDPVQIAIIRENLEQHGFCVHDAGGGHEGLEKMSLIRPDVVVLDAKMPETDGFTVCAQMASRPDLKAIPVIITTGADNVASIARAFDVGVAEFVAKPINTALLPNRIRNVLLQREHLGQHQNELLSATYALAAAMVGADGKVLPVEIEVAETIGANLFDAFDPVEFREMCYAHETRPHVPYLAGILSHALDEEGKGAILAFLKAISEVDKDVAPEEAAILSEVRTAFEAASVRG